MYSSDIYQAGMIQAAGVPGAVGECPIGPTHCSCLKTRKMPIRPSSLLLQYRQEHNVDPQVSRWGREAVLLVSCALWCESDARWLLYSLLPTPVTQPCCKPAASSSSQAKRGHRNQSSGTSLQYPHYSQF